MGDLTRVLRPSSIAVIGGGFWCEKVIRQCKAMSFDGPIWPVHPKRDQLGGVSTYSSISELPGAPDAVFLGINREASIAAIAELSALGAGGAVVFASGFAEAEAEDPTGPDAQERLLQAAGGMAILGPNCYGFINYLDGALLWPDQHGGERVERGVALIAQSSNIAINLTMQARGLPLAYVLTVGNQAQVSLAEAGLTALADPRVTALGLYIEGFGDIRAFEALATEARRLGKMIVAFKAGKSEAARAATISHTASLAGGDAASNAFLERLGIPRVYGIPELLETLKLFHIAGPLGSNRIASLSCSGGEASLFADTVEGRNVILPPLSESQRKDLRDALGPKVALANPLDYHTYIWNDRPAMVKAYSAMLGGDAEISFLILDFPRADRCDFSDWFQAVEAFADACTAKGAKGAVLATMAENLPETLAKQIAYLGLAPMIGVSEAIGAVEAGFQWSQAGSHDPVLLPQESANRIETLSEYEAKAIFSDAGLQLPKRAFAKTVEDACECAVELGFPVVLKGQGIAHKSEAGAVVLNLMNKREIENAARQMTGVEGFLVEQMLPVPIAELLVGISHDPAMGYVLTLGAGGVMTELLNDTTCLLLPASPEAIEKGLRKLKIFGLLNGFRGRNAADIRKLVMEIAKFAAVAETMHKELEEMEINPLMVYEDRAIAADALIVRRVT